MKYYQKRRVGQLVVVNNGVGNVPKRIIDNGDEFQYINET